MSFSAGYIVTIREFHGNINSTDLFKNSDSFSNISLRASHCFAHSTNLFKKTDSFTKETPLLYCLGCITVDHALALSIFCSAKKKYLQNKVTGNITYNVSDYKSHKNKGNVKSFFPRYNLRFLFIH